MEQGQSPRGDVGMDLGSAHKVLVTEDGIIRDLDEVAAQHLRAEDREALIGSPIGQFIPEQFGETLADNPRWKALFDTSVPSDLKPRVCQRLDGEEVIVYFLAVEGPQIEGQRSIWIYSWTLATLDGMPVTTAMPVGALVKEQWQLAQLAAERDMEFRVGASLHEKLIERSFDRLDDIDTRMDEMAQAATGRTAALDQVSASQMTLEERLHQLQRQVIGLCAAVGGLGATARRLLAEDVSADESVQAFLLQVAVAGGVANDMLIEMTASDAIL